MADRLACKTSLLLSNGTCITLQVGIPWTTEMSKQTQGSWYENEGGVGKGVGGRRERKGKEKGENINYCFNYRIYPSIRHTF